MKQEYLDLIYLVGCGVNEVKPDIQRIKVMNLPMVFRLAKYHTLTAVSFYALESSDFKPGTAEEKAIYAEWQELKKKAITKNMLLDGARADLFQWLDEQHIWHCALKGSVLKDLYPRAGMRQMADNDILFDAKYQQEVHDWFISHDYNCKAYQTGSHDVYQKPPIYNFEMHTALFGRGHDPAFVDYYENIADRLEMDGYDYHFNDDDFYIYFLSHAYKHYSGGGTGLRTLADFYVYNKVKGNQLDRDYINAECSKLGIADYEKSSRSLACKVFSEPTEFQLSVLSEKKMNMLSAYLGAGTYGTRENAVRNRLKKINPNEKRPSTITKARYILGQAFPDARFMHMWCGQYFPIATKQKWLLPLAYPYRLIIRFGSGIQAIKFLHKI